MGRKIFIAKAILAVTLLLMGWPANAHGQGVRLRERVQEFRQELQGKRTQGYDVSEAERLMTEAGKARRRGDEQTAEQLFEAAFTALRKAKEVDLNRSEKKSEQQLPGNGEYASPFNLFFKVRSGTNEEDLRFAADNAAVVKAIWITAPWANQHLSFMKNINPELHIAIYHALRGVGRTDPLLEEIEGHEDWFLHCERDPGKRVINERYGNYLMDIGNREYRNFWIERTRKALENNPQVNVLFIDLAAPRLFRKLFYGSWPIEKYSDDNWAQWVTEFLKEIKSAFPQKMVIANSIKPGYSDSKRIFGGKFTGIHYADYVDGLSAETWVYIYGRYRGEDFWRTMLNAYVSKLKQGKWIAVVQHPEKFKDEHNKPIPWDDDRRMFGFASSLLIGSETFGFMERIPGGSAGGKDIVQRHPIFYIPLGEPQERLRDRVDNYLSNGVYTRKYENGLVLVNPGPTKTKTYILSQEMNLVILKGKTIGYKTVKEVVLPPASGAILIFKKKSEDRATKTYYPGEEMVE